MLKIPINLDRLKSEDLNKEILRAAIMAELDAVNPYEHMSVLAEDKHINLILLDSLKKKKHMLKNFRLYFFVNDKQQEEELAECKKEVEELMS